MTDLTGEYLRWVINAALETTSLILWWQGSVTQVQPVLFPDNPFRWLDDSSHNDLVVQPDRRN